jgi:hypothetical protein
LAKYQREWVSSKLEVSKVYRYKSYQTKAGDEREKYGRFVAYFSELEKYPAISYSGKASRYSLVIAQINLYESLVADGKIEAVR